MLRTAVLGLIVMLMVGTSVATRAPADASLFERMTGRWVLRGTIGGKQTVHDITADLVLNKGYVRIHEVSREKDPHGAPAYEAIVFISVDQKTGQYSCLWLDSTGNGGLVPEGIGHGMPTADSIPFVFRNSADDVTLNTFVYTAKTDSWQWQIDNEVRGKRTPFARVTLTRK